MVSTHLAALGAVKCNAFNTHLAAFGAVSFPMTMDRCIAAFCECTMFQSFCNFSNRIKNKSEKELALLRDNPQIWSCYSVFDQLLVCKNGDDLLEAAGEYASRPMYKQSNKMARPGEALPLYLILYSTMSVDKLASFLEIEANELRHLLTVAKIRSRQVKWVQGTLLGGEVTSTSDLDLCLKGDMIHISESKVGHRYGDWFLRNISKFQDISAGLELTNKS
ncbi:hypothetical protein BGW41_005460 [Actinomortierella wolfii]|nr:hypothetical protein BGW41_005460 [Actinomortierella wolfii]